MPLQELLPVLLQSTSGLAIISVGYKPRGAGELEQENRLPCYSKTTKADGSNKKREREREREREAERERVWKKKERERE